MSVLRNKKPEWTHCGSGAEQNKMPGLKLSVKQVVKMFDFILDRSLRVTSVCCVWGQMTKIKTKRHYKQRLLMRRGGGNNINKDMWLMLTETGATSPGDITIRSFLRKIFSNFIFIQKFYTEETVKMLVRQFCFALGTKVGWNISPVVHLTTWLFSSRINDAAFQANVLSVSKHAAKFLWLCTFATWSSCSPRDFFSSRIPIISRQKYKNMFG